MFFALLATLVIEALAVSAKTVTYNWSATWVWAQPDGHSGIARPVIGINGKFPCPTIEADVGDEVVVNLFNGLGNETTSLHFHGLYQNGTTTMDGPTGVSQCPIWPGSSFTYKFSINQTGTYWYHSHDSGQYPDGLRGPLIIHDPHPPFQYDEEIVMTVSDWWWSQMPYLINYYQSTTNQDIHGGSEPVPNSTLINDSYNVPFHVKPGSTYLFRIINMGQFASQFIYFEDHEMSIVEVDGVYTQQASASQISVAVAQRYAVLIKTKTNTKRNYGILTSMDTSMFDESVIPPSTYRNLNQTGYLIYDDSIARPKQPIVQAFTPIDDICLAPFDRMPILEPTHVFHIPFDFNAINDIQRAVIIKGDVNTTYLTQKVPTLYTVLSAPDTYYNNSIIYGENSNSLILNHLDVIEINLINYDDGAHPWHLHAHNFQLISRHSPSPPSPPLPCPSTHNPSTPLRRDTVTVPASGSIKLRFVADNPGVWLFHCHLEWHVDAGLITTIIEAPDQLRKSGIKIPDDHLKACGNNMPAVQTKGNAGGNDRNWGDLSGANTAVNRRNFGSCFGCK